MQFNDTQSSVADRTRKENLAGGEAFAPDSPELALYKVTINNLLEDTYYESDSDSLEKVRQRFDACASDNPEFALKLAYWAREEAYLRQIPQLLLVLAANHPETKEYVDDYATGVMQRADEPLEALAMQVSLFGKSIPNSLQRGFENALHTYDEYEFAKYDSSNREFQYRDLLNLVHPNPRDDLRDDIFECIALGELDDYDAEPLKQHRTWENERSQDDDDRDEAEVWRDTLDDMGLMAKIRNVRNMRQAGLDGDEILTDEDIDAIPHVKLYPFRFYQAYTALKYKNSDGMWSIGRTSRSPSLSSSYLDNWFERALDKSVENVPEEFADTYVGVDLSGSMDAPISDDSTLHRKEISALFGAICAKKGAGVSGFAHKFKEFTFHAQDPILSMQEQIMSASIGTSTNGHKVLEYLTEKDRAFENVAIFTDLQLWNDGSSLYRSTGSLKDAWDRYTEEVAPDASLYVIDLANYGDLVTPEGYPNVYNISGWTSNVVKHIKYASDERAAIEQVEAVEAPDGE